MLGLLFAAAAWCLVRVPVAKAVAAPARRQGREPPAFSPLSESDGRLVALGRRLAAGDPGLARFLLRDADHRLAAAAPRPRLTRRTRWARHELLEPARVREEFERGAVVIADGWLLARSEAALCVYLHVLATDPGRC